MRPQAETKRSASAMSCLVILGERGMSPSATRRGREAAPVYNACYPLVPLYHIVPALSREKEKQRRSFRCFSHSPAARAVIFSRKNRFCTTRSAVFPA